MQQQHYHDSLAHLRPSMNAKLSMNAAKITMNVVSGFTHHMALNDCQAVLTAVTVHHDGDPDATQRLTDSKLSRDAKRAAVSIDQSWFTSTHHCKSATYASGISPALHDAERYIAFCITCIMKLVLGWFCNSCVWCKQCNHVYLAEEHT